MSPKKRRDAVHEVRPEYDFSGAVRGKYYSTYRQGAKVHFVNDSAAEGLALVFDDDGPVDAARLGDVLFLLRGAYAAGVQSARSMRPAGILVDAAQHVRSYLRRLNVEDVNNLFTCDLGSASLVTRSISYQSPLRMHLSGSAEGLDAAVLLAGGALRDENSDDAEVGLGPLAQVAETLRGALMRGVGAPLGYGVRSRRLRLSKPELLELLRHDPVTQNRGGFQRFLIGLQSRVNRVSGEIDLSEAEIATILKYGRNPRRGGWQTSIRKIFGNHFDFVAD